MCAPGELQLLPMEGLPGGRLLPLMMRGGSQQLLQGHSKVVAAVAGDGLTAKGQLAPVLLCLLLPLLLAPEFQV